MNQEGFLKGKGLWKLSAWLLIFLLICSSSVSVFALHNDSTLDNDPYFLLIEEVFEHLQGYHVSTPEAEQLFYGAVKGMLDTLDDPYTDLLTAQEFKQFLQSVDGRLVGIGTIVQLNEQGQVMVIQVLPGGPAEKAGLRAGDVITHINGKQQAFETIDQAVMLIRGEPETTVSLTINRLTPTGLESLTYNIKREEIQLPQLNYEMLDEGIAWLQLFRFSSDLGEQTAAALTALEEQGMQQLILDLRGNQGGYLHAALDVATLFKSSGAIVHVLNSQDILQTYTIDQGEDFNLPVIVLVDNETASAGEILAGFFQDHELGVLMGERTFGKGTVQTLLPLSYGYALKVTIQEYFTPEQNQVHFKGITPNITVTGKGQQLGKAVQQLTNQNDVLITKEGYIQWNYVEDITASTALYKNGKIYLSIRELAEWYNGKVGWNAKTQSIELNLIDRYAALHKEEQGIIVENGKSYIALDRLVELFPLELIEHSEGQVLKLK